MITWQLQRVAVVIAVFTSLDFRFPTLGVVAYNFQINSKHSASSFVIIETSRCSAIKANYDRQPGPRCAEAQVTADNMLLSPILRAGGFYSPESGKRKEVDVIRSSKRFERVYLRWGLCRLVWLNTTKIPARAVRARV
jgi:hypothetical protein